MDYPASQEIHLWWTWIETHHDVIKDCSKVLSTDECERAGRFVFVRDRHRFVVARAMLRKVLAQYLGLGVQEFGFKYGIHGKPYLNTTDRAEDLQFNIAHSDALAICAVTCGRQVGVDIERIRTIADFQQLATIAFSFNEQAKLATLPYDQQLLGFFNCWTRKEAYVKACGEGLLMPLDTFDVSLVPGEPVALAANRLNPDESLRWSLHSISPATGYVGAVAVEGQIEHLCLRQWNPTEGAT